MLAHRGAGSVFLLNSLSFIGVIVVLYRWKRIPLFKSALPAERLVGSMRSGLRYIRHAPVLRATLMRAFLFTFFVSAVWALLAVVPAKRDLHQGAMGYGILNGSLGLGALVGASVLARIRKRALGRCDDRSVDVRLYRHAGGAGLRACACGDHPPSPDVRGLCLDDRR